MWKLYIRNNGLVLTTKKGECENGIFTFEKVTGNFLRSARQELLNREETKGADGTTADCGKICLEMGSDCPSYSVDYTQVINFNYSNN